MPLTVLELKSGIAYWQKKKTRWPQDFHNAFYQQMADANPNGNFTASWWSEFLHELSRWKALRPKPQSFVTYRATQRFQKLSQDWTSSIKPVWDSDIATIQWSQIAPFSSTVAQIKNVSSPVFTSKFCHFLAPHIFPVIDNAAMGNSFPTYQAYYSHAQSQWAATSALVQCHLIEMLSAAIGANPTQSYPMKCKIIELCLVGKYQRGLSDDLS